jgi:plasmid stabilization system protein ParE
VSLPVVLRDEAQAEFDEAFDYYEGQRPGLGVDFAERVQRVFDQIAVNPQQHAVVFADIRKAVVTRFPYCVFYRADATRVEVIAVFHSRRDPSIWQGRA